MSNRVLNKLGLITIGAGIAFIILSPIFKRTREEIQKGDEECMKLTNKIFDTAFTNPFMDTTTHNRKEIQKNDESVCCSEGRFNHGES